MLPGFIAALACLLISATALAGSVPINANRMDEVARYFFLVPFEAQFEFIKDKNGKVTGMVLRHGHAETFAKRTSSSPAP